MQQFVDGYLLRLFALLYSEFFFFFLWFYIAIQPYFENVGYVSKTLFQVLLKHNQNFSCGSVKMLPSLCYNDKFFLHPSPP